MNLVANCLQIDLIEDIGKQLYSLLKDEHKDDSSGGLRFEQIAYLIDKAIGLINDYRSRNHISKEIKKPCLIECIFSSFYRLDAKKQCQVMTQCSLEFLRWCRGMVAKHRRIPRTMLVNFYFDTAFMGYLGPRFCKGQPGRSHRWIPIDTFEQVFAWFCFDRPPERERLAGEFLCIFELRQSMEVKFRRLLGIDSISDGVRILHSVIPNILKRNVTKENFNPGEGGGLTQVMHVYDWTNKSVHNMETDYVWIVWKAMMVVWAFFKPIARTNGMMSIHDSFEFSNSLLEKMRNEFIDEVMRANKRDFTIEWGEPEAAIVDENGKWMKVCKRVQNVKFDRNESGKEQTLGSEQTV